MSVFLTLRWFNFMSVFGSFVFSDLHLVPTTNTPHRKKIKVLLPAVGQMGLPLLAARPQPHWGTSDPDLCKNINNSFQKIIKC